MLPPPIIMFHNVCFGCESKTGLKTYVNLVLVHANTKIYKESRHICFFFHLWFEQGAAKKSNDTCTLWSLLKPNNFKMQVRMKLFEILTCSHVVFKKHRRIQVVVVFFSRHTLIYSHNSVQQQMSFHISNLIVLGNKIVLLFHLFS